MLLQKPSAHQVSAGGGLDVVILQATDGAVHLEHCQRNILGVSDAMFPQSTLEIIPADVLFRHVGVDDLAVVYQQAGLTLNQFPEAAIDSGKLSDKVIHQQQRGSS